MLGVQPGAPPVEVVSAYRRLLQIYHPDRYEVASPEIRAEAEQRMTEVNVAYDCLRNSMARSGASPHQSSSGTPYEGPSFPFLSLEWIGVANSRGVTGGSAGPGRGWNINLTLTTKTPSAFNLSGGSGASWIFASGHSSATTKQLIGREQAVRRQFGLARMGGEQDSLREVFKVVASGSIIDNEWRNVSDAERFDFFCPMFLSIGQSLRSATNLGRAV